jgi:hypothetical protein
MALLGFFLPYWGSSSGYTLARYYGTYWLEGALILAVFLLLGARFVIPALKVYRRRWAVALLAVGAFAAFYHHSLMGSASSDWTIGAWFYFLGMIVVGIGGLLSLA